MNEYAMQAFYIVMTVAIFGVARIGFSRRRERRELEKQLAAERERQREQDEIDSKRQTEEALAEASREESLQLERLRAAVERHRQNASTDAAKPESEAPLKYDE